MQKVLGMNARNALIRHVNPRQSCYLVKDKAKTKDLLKEVGIGVADTYALLSERPTRDFFSSLNDTFVIKPNRGAKGSGIVLLRRVSDDLWETPSSKQFDSVSLLRHCSRILAGEFSGSRFFDEVLIEEVLHPSEAVKFNDPIGLPDVRIISSPFIPHVAMMRYPTRQSDGKANLAKGAIGIAIDAASGLLYRAYEPSTKQEIPLAEVGIPENHYLPKWSEAMKSAEKAVDATGLELPGIDFVLDDTETWKVLEVNSSPGLEIQNVTGVPLQILR